jgi:nicotinate-nucleotide pyrophosphorylase (carboxylating)
MEYIRQMNLEATRQLIRLALAEDVGQGDLTAAAVPAETRAVAKLVAKEPCVLSGLRLVPLVLEEFGADAAITFPEGSRDGAQVEAGDLLLRLEGRARDLLTTERLILNLLQRLCGIATQADRFRQALGELPVKILDTRKTTPGLRAWEKEAVRHGGLHNHRQRLDDGVLIKENHIRAAGSIRQALTQLGAVSVPLEVEVTCWEEAEEALAGGVTRLLLDNFTPAGLKEIVPRLRARQAGLYLEASGGLTLGNLRDFASTGVDAVSVGALTHSVRAVDLSLLFEFS